MKDLIKELNDKNQEISNKDFEIRELIKQQVTLIRKYLNEYSKVINFYLENHMKFFHPDFNVSTEKGPILAYIEKTKDMIIYKKIQMTSSYIIQIRVSIKRRNGFYLCEKLLKVDTLIVRLEE